MSSAPPPFTDTTKRDEDSSDVHQYLTAVRKHQEALWAVLSHCNIVIGPVLEGDFGPYLGIRVYRPTSIGAFDVKAWWEPRREAIAEVLREAASDAWPGVSANVEPRWIMPVPDQLADFVAKNTGRPMRGRFNSQQGAE